MLTAHEFNAISASRQRDVALRYHRDHSTVDRCGLSNGPSAEHLTYSAPTDFRRPLAAKNQSPAFEPVAARLAEAVDGKLAAPC